MIGVKRDNNGFVQADDILGLSPRGVVRSSKGVEYRIHEPTLSNYTKYSPRLVTPVSWCPILPLLSQLYDDTKLFLSLPKTLLWL
jgi:hypothetical protein